MADELDYQTWLKLKGVPDNEGSKLMYEADRKAGKLKFPTPGKKLPAPEPTLSVNKDAKPVPPPAKLPSLADLNKLDQDALNRIAAQQHGGYQPPPSAQAQATAKGTPLGGTSGAWDAANLADKIKAEQAAKDAAGPSAKELAAKLGLSDAYNQSNDAFLKSLSEGKKTPVPEVKPLPVPEVKVPVAEKIKTEAIKTIPINNLEEGGQAKVVTEIKPPSLADLNKVQEEVPVKPKADEAPLSPQTKAVVDDPTAVKGIDWGKVGEIAKSTGKSILGVLDSAIQGQLAASQKRKVDFKNDTMLGREAALKEKADDLIAQNEIRKQDLTERQSMSDASDLQKFQWQKELTAINQDYQDKKDAAEAERAAALRAAQTEEQKAAAQTAYEQRLAEIKLQVRLQSDAQLAAIKEQAKTAQVKTQGANPLGL